MPDESNGQEVSEPMIVLDHQTGDVTNTQNFDPGYLVPPTRGKAAYGVRTV